VAVDKLTSKRPYLLRAMHEWMSDNNLTPHVVIDVETAQSGLPVEYANDGKLVINISYAATENLIIGNDSVSFDARFSGVSRHLDVPIVAVLGIYARESGQGMIFSSESADQASAVAADEDAADGNAKQSDKDADPKASKSSRPQLKIIK